MDVATAVFTPEQAQTRWDEFCANDPRGQVAGVMAAARNIVGEADHGYCDPDASSGIACVYVKDEKPSCLIAQILYRLGFWHLNRLEGRISSNAGVTGMGQVHRNVFLVMAAMQAVQDAGGTWALALRAGDGVENALRNIPAQ